MSGFGDNFDQPEVDPAAEFLAREQDELAGLEDEVKPAAITVPVINGDDQVNSVGSFELIDGIDQDGPKEPSFNVNEVNDFLFDAESYDALPALQTDDFRGASPSPPPQRQEDRVEPEKIRKWREEQVKRLEEKDREEEKKKLELREIAKKELEDWYKNHEETIAKTKAANRNAEKQFVAEDNDLEPGTEWERIAKLCDFNPKAKQGSKDVSRMRSIILQMKQNPVPIKNKA
ncbi:clathrin light chain isoform X2 [Anoplophora glabripennis]|uniref:clathrin light chain isoform X2 n=1 Tax=Anoplophora glabripennis TaxID=217634 RepID=UPI0008738F9C|nr:clathrin light chain isoform X2 [Anoplophora glabripennis]